MDSLKDQVTSLEKKVTELSARLEKSALESAAKIKILFAVIGVMFLLMIILRFKK